MVWCVFISPCLTRCFVRRIRIYRKKANWPNNIKTVGGESVEEVKSSNTKENVNAQELQIIKLMRELDYGQLVVSVKNGKPVHVETRKSITLNP